MSYSTGNGFRQKLYDKYYKQLVIDGDYNAGGEMLKIIHQLMLKIDSKGVSTWYGYLRFSEGSDLWNYKAPDDAPDSLKLFFNHIEDEFDNVEDVLNEHSDAEYDEYNAGAQVNANLFDKIYIDNIVETILQYIKHHPTLPSWKNLPEKMPNLAGNVEWLDEMMEADQGASKSGKWFYNTRDLDSNKKIVRVFDHTLLNKIRNGENPYTRAKWNRKVLARFTVADAGNGKMYYNYNNKKYLIRTGPRGGKFILVKGEKRRI